MHDWKQLVFGILGLSLYRVRAVEVLTSMTLLATCLGNIESQNCP